MAQKQTRLYYNTGFNVGNTPGTLSVLNSASYTDFESHWDYQDYFLQSLKLKATWDQVKNADYLKFGNAYYWVIGISMINENNAELYLQLDALATLGGCRNLNYTSGILKRAHPKTDNPFENTLAEPIGPQEHLYSDGGTVIGPDSVAGHMIILSTLSLEQSIMQDPDTGAIVPTDSEIAVATKYSTIGSDIGEVVVPASPKPATGCRVGLTNQAIDYYYADSDTKVSLLSNQIAYLRSLGLEQAVVGAYLLPDAYKGTASGSGITGKMSTLNTAITVNTESAQVWDRGTGRHWNKSMYMNNIYVLVSRLTGEVKTYDAKDVVQQGASSPRFVIGCDPNINGKPYAWPEYFDNAAQTGNFGANGVSGMEWLNIPIVVGGASGSLWIRNDYVRNTAEIATQTVQMGYNNIKNVVKGIGEIANASSSYNKAGDMTGSAYDNGGVSGLGTITNAAVNTAFSAKKLMYAAEKLDTDFAQANIQVPGVSGNNVTGLQTSIPNNFICYHYTMSNDDIAKVDAFFDRYGYAQNRVFDKSYMDLNPNGQGFCYIQTEDIHISRNAGAGIAIRNLAEQQLNGGVRIWHQLPG